MEGVFRLLTLMKKIVAYYNNGLSFISLGFLGYFPGVVPVFLFEDYAISVQIDCIGSGLLLYDFNAYAYHLFISKNKRLGH